MNPSSFKASNYSHASSAWSGNSGTKPDTNPDTVASGDDRTHAPSVPFQNKARRLLASQILNEGDSVTTAVVIFTVKDGKLDVIEPFQTPKCLDSQWYTVNHPDTREYNTQSSFTRFSGTFESVDDSSLEAGSGGQPSYQLSIDSILAPNKERFETDGGIFRNDKGDVQLENDHKFYNLEDGVKYALPDTTIGKPMIARVKPVFPNTS